MPILPVNEKQLTSLIWTSENDLNLMASESVCPKFPFQLADGVSTLLSSDKRVLSYNNNIIYNEQRYIVNWVLGRPICS